MFHRLEILLCTDWLKKQSDHVVIILYAMSNDFFMKDGKFVGTTEINMLNKILKRGGLGIFDIIS